MSEIFHQSHHQLNAHLQQGPVNVESQCNWSFESDLPLPFDEFAGSPFTNFSCSPVDELTAIIVENQSPRKRKLESVDCNSGLTGPPKATRSIHNGNLQPMMDPKPVPDYIHVRARRGQATDSHSLAERARREKMKKKMQCLQDMVPGCNKLTNKTAILDEIITYIQCLQRDVEFLSIKLAASTTSANFDMDYSSPEETLSQW